MREIEAGLREARAEIRLEAVKEAQAIVNGVQGQLYGELRQLAVEVDRLAPSAGRPANVARDDGTPVIEGRRATARRADGPKK